MNLNECKNCRKYEGDCGRHYKGEHNHINFDIPAESACDKHGDCCSFEAKPPRVTYGDMIRKMNDDELAAFIFSIHEDETSYAKYFSNKPFDFGLIYESEDLAEKLKEYVDET